MLTDPSLRIALIQWHLRLARLIQLSAGLWLTAEIGVAIIMAEPMPSMIWAALLLTAATLYARQVKRFVPGPVLRHALGEQPARQARQKARRKTMPINAAIMGSTRL
jgi:hypothetical protein